MLKIKRIYEQSSKEDGIRILIDRLWPRGISKENADLDDWSKEIAPTNELRKAFHQKEISFEAFEKAYLKELAENPQAADFRAYIKKVLSEGNVTLLYGAKDTAHNQAVVLQEWLQNINN
ncbi:DUF488 domain-containing protein [Listeria ilorinensis]|uniref:DUF488 domain-containing protein n=1 Tax=Listeria ilorinensis TaxID=2867439 RepID=UPI001EF55818|nr:DUF488 domain-containing protein [Listeria ilorinensis]